jgi:hypothetical protein
MVLKTRSPWVDFPFLSGPLVPYLEAETIFPAKDLEELPTLED